MIRLLRLFAAAVAVSVLAACGGGAQDGASPDSDARPRRAFTVLAGSEIKDVDTQLGDDIRKATGIDVRFTYSGTLDAIDRLNAGEAFDAVWVSHGKYLAMNPTLKSRIKAQEKSCCRR